jgi:hypothetical protein
MSTGEALELHSVHGKSVEPKRKKQEKLKKQEKRKKRKKQPRSTFEDTRSTVDKKEIRGIKFWSEVKIVGGRPLQGGLPGLGRRH